jgi:hypothetical protein
MSQRERGGPALAAEKPSERAAWYQGHPAPGPLGARSTIRAMLAVAVSVSQRGSHCGFVGLCDQAGRAEELERPRFTHGIAWVTVADVENW